MLLNDFLKEIGIDSLLVNTSAVNDISYIINNIHVEKRAGNKKRKFLFVNEVMGKHIPVYPSKVEKLCKMMSDALLDNKEYQRAIKGKGDNILVINFAETALLIGELVADNIAFGTNKGVIQVNTSRIADTTIKLCEEHSHNTQLGLTLPNDLSNCDTIVIIDDEISTGKTIKNLVREIAKEYNLKDKTIIGLSVLNTTGKDKDILRDGNVLLGCDNIQINYISLISTKLNIDDINQKMQEELKASVENTDVYIGDVLKGAKKLSEQIKDCMYYGEDIKNIGVIGTEENMASGFKIAKFLEDNIKDVKTTYQATTRSPINTSEYIKNKNIISSPYKVINEKTNNSYIYNLDKKDMYIVVLEVQDNQESTEVERFKEEIVDILISYTHNIKIVTVYNTVKKRDVKNVRLSK